MTNLVNNSPGRNSLLDTRTYLARLEQNQQTALNSRYHNALHDANVSTIVQIALTVLVIVLAIITAIVIVRNIRRRLRLLTEHMRSLVAAAGDLTIRLPLTSRDEIDDTVQAFNSFLDTIADIVRGMISDSTRLSSSTIQVSAANEMTAGAERARRGRSCVSRPPWRNVGGQPGRGPQRTSPRPTRPRPR